MADIIQFAAEPEFKETTHTLQFNIKDEIAKLNKEVDRYTEKEISYISFADYNGALWKEFFEEACVPMAEVVSEDPWDVFAVLVRKMAGEEELT